MKPGIPGLKVNGQTKQLSQEAKCLKARNMDELNWIEIARTGTFTDSAGRAQTFTAADLAAIAAAYNPQKRDCPLVFGHPQSDSAPAFGWARKIRAEGDRLLADFEKVSEQVRALVAAGHYRHVSMSLMPDRKTLRHVALLGAAQPAIDGLKAVELADGKDAINVEFATKGGGTMPDTDTLKEIGALKERLKALEAENATLKQQAQANKEGKEKAEAAKTEAQAKADMGAFFSSFRIASSLRNTQASCTRLHVAKEKALTDISVNA